MVLHDFLELLQKSPEKIRFKDTMAVIEAEYMYTPMGFTNNTTNNASAQNAGSCKLFAFAQLHQLSEAQTLHCFGDYYREDVLKHPQGTDHQNIRNFMNTGWKGIRFDGEVLRPRN